VEATEHQPTIELVDDLPPEVDAGGVVVVRVRVSCPGACDLHGGILNAEHEGERIGTSLLAPSEDSGPHATATLTLKAPARVGEWTYVVTFPEQQVAGVVHQGCALRVSSTVVPHATSLAVWGVPSPVRGSPFTVQVGVKCSAPCRMGGRLVEVRDEAGTKVAEGTLGPDPRPGTAALYEARVSLVAPERAGVYSRSVHFPGTELDLPHTEASGTFSFRAVEPPQHTVTVRVLPKGIDASLDAIEVRLGPYSAWTDAGGLARVGVPKGRYEVSAWRIDIEPVSTHVLVAGDDTVELEATPRHVVDEDADRWG
jgi:hypothetical protein